MDDREHLSLGRWHTLHYELDIKLRPDGGRLSGWLTV